MRPAGGPGMWVAQDQGGAGGSRPGAGAVATRNWRGKPLDTICPSGVKFAGRDIPDVKRSSEDNQAHLAIAPRFGAVLKSI
jgi:hypothetical protein